jgi:hypothetical protein
MPLLLHRVLHPLRFALILSVVLLAGCHYQRVFDMRNSFQSAVEQMPVLRPAYLPDVDSTSYSSRPVLLEAEADENGDRRTFFSVIANCPGPPDSACSPSDFTLTFFSESEAPRFTNDSALILEADGAPVSVGPLRYRRQQTSPRSDDIIGESLTASIPAASVEQLAEAPIVEGVMGPVTFTLEHEDFASIRAYLDAFQKSDEAP